MKTLLFTFWLLMLAPALGGEPLPEVRLVDQTGATFNLAELKGNFSFLSFFYTSCPVSEACPLTARLAKHLVEWWKVKFPDTPFRVLLITLDPRRDTPEALRRFAARHGLDPRYITLATGEERFLTALRNALGVSGAPDYDGNFLHDSRSFLVDPELIVVRVFEGNGWKPREVVQSVQLRLISASFIPLPGR